MVEKQRYDARESCHECGSTDYELFQEGVSYSVECAECGEPVGYVPSSKQLGGFKLAE